jgi:very-short-patch-repair endonuclease
MNRSKDLRSNTSPPEQILWKRLRNRQVGGYKFRRQHPIGAYVADFFCDEAKLVVELDSSYHNQSQTSDDTRDAWMRSHGIEVIRVHASTLMKNERGVLELILSTTRARVEQRELEGSKKKSPHPGPLPEGEGGGADDAVSD